MATSYREVTRVFIEPSEFWPEYPKGFHITVIEDGSNDYIRSRFMTRSPAKQAAILDHFGIYERRSQHDGDRFVSIHHNKTHVAVYAGWDV